MLFLSRKVESAPQPFCLSLRLGSPLHHPCDPARLHPDHREDPWKGQGLGAGILTVSYTE